MDTTGPTAVDLRSRDRTYLRGLAHHLQSIVQVGQAGVTDGVITSIELALLNHELIKVRLHEPDDKNGMARELAARTSSAMCGLVGHTVILYRPHPDDPQIKLPKAQ